MASDHINKHASINTVTSFRAWTISTVLILIACLIIFSSCFSRDTIATQMQKNRVLISDIRKQGTGSQAIQSEDDTCLSRAQESLLRKEVYSVPAKLRDAWSSHRQMQRRCLTQSNLGCKYVVISDAEEVGLGNRLAALASAVIFGLATDRVILLDNRKKLGDLLCNPFTDTTWLLPEPGHSDEQGQLINQGYILNQSDYIYQTVIGGARTLGWYVEKQSLSDVASTSAPLKIRLWDEPPESELALFDDATYAALADVKWVVWESDLYTIPNLFLVPRFWRRIAPLLEGAEGDVFRHISSLALMPANRVWTLVVKEYVAYMDDASDTVGVQVRLHGRNDRAAYDVRAYEMLRSCLVDVSHYLPAPLPADVHTQEFQSLAVQYARRIMSRQRGADVAVLVASLQDRYFQRMKAEYSQSLGTDNRAVVRVHTVSGLEKQDFSQQQAELALAEMWLLSVTQHVATSASSTFGYAAASWGRLRPLILHFPKLAAGSPNLEEFCQIGYASDPCSHLPRPCQGFRIGRLSSGHATWLAAHLRRCQDRPEAAWQLVHGSVDSSLAPPVF